MPLVVTTSMSAAASTPGLLRDDSRGGVVRHTGSERLGSGGLPWQVWVAQTAGM